jgi:hypothetical protein
LNSLQFRLWLSKTRNWKHILKANIEAQSISQKWRKNSAWPFCGWHAEKYSTHRYTPKAWHVTVT